MLSRRKNALIIVHLSSLDAYTALAREEHYTFDDMGFALAEDFIGYIKNAVAKQEQVFVVDQAWALGYKESRPREMVLDAVQDLPINWILFADDDDPAMIDQEVLARFPYQRIAPDGIWKKFLPALVNLLRSAHVTHVTVGGIWFSDELSYGCATAVYEYLKKRFRVEVGPVGAESDFIQSLDENLEMDDKHVVS